MTASETGRVFSCGCTVDSDKPCPYCSDPASGRGPSWDQDCLAALAYWSEQIRPTLGDLPMEGLRFLRDQYVTDVQINPTALAELRAWWVHR